MTDRLYIFLPSSVLVYSTPLHDKHDADTSRHAKDYRLAAWRIEFFTLRQKRAHVCNNDIFDFLHHTKSQVSASSHRWDFVYVRCIIVRTRLTQMFPSDENRCVSNCICYHDSIVHEMTLRLASMKCNTNRMAWDGTEWNETS